MKHYTTFAQSMKLLELGLSPESADMSYEYMDECDGNFPYYDIPVCYPPENNKDIHCWSVGALLEVMPLYIEPTEDSIFTFSLWKTQIGEASVIYSNDDIDEVAVEFDSKNLIDACYEMVCWLLENDYIKKGE